MHHSVSCCIGVSIVQAAHMKLLHHDEKGHNIQKAPPCRTESVKQSCWKDRTGHHHKLHPLLQLRLPTRLSMTGNRVASLQSVLWQCLPHLPLGHQATSAGEAEPIYRM